VENCYSSNGLTCSQKKKKRMVWCFSVGCGGGWVGVVTRLVECFSGGVGFWVCCRLSDLPFFVFIGSFSQHYFECVFHSGEVEEVVFPAPFRAFFHQFGGFSEVCF